MDTNRLEAFSDGVFAIAITLLVLAIAVPPSDASLGTSLLHLWPSYVAYVVSFVAIGAIWMNHHAMFRHVARSDGTLLLLNLLQLMVVAFLPFPTAVLADAFHHAVDESIAAAFYGGTLVVLGFVVTMTWSYAAHGHRLLGSGLTPTEARRIGRRYLVGPLAYLIATGIAFAAPWFAVALYLLIHVYYIWPSRIHDAHPSAEETGHANAP